MKRRKRNPVEKNKGDEQNLELAADGGIVGSFNRAIDRYSSISSEELLEFLGTLEEEEKTE